MTRTEASKRLIKYLDRLDIWDNGLSANDGTKIMEFLVQDLGMLPPLNEVKLVPDELRGDTKHSPSKREWDKE